MQSVHHNVGDLRSWTTRARGAIWRGLAALGVTLALGCEHPATSIIVRVDSDIPWGEGQRVQSVALEVRRGSAGGALLSRRVTAVGAGNGRLRLPLFVGVNETLGDTATPLWIEALACAQSVGCARDGAASAQRAVVQFVPEQTVELRLLLSSMCGPSRCGLDQSCAPSGVCDAATSAQASLRPIDAIPTDAQSVASGSDAAADARTDTAPLDTAPLDTAPLDTTPLDSVATDAAPTDTARTDAAPLDGAATDAASTDGAPADAAPLSDLAPMVDATPADRADPVDATADGASSDVRPSDVGPADAAPTDAGSMDAAPSDVGLTDAGPMDASADASSDAAPTDAGPRDAGPADTGPTDTGPAFRCPTGMLAIPAGQFLMGRTVLSFEQPVHGVRLSAFCVDETEVTVAAYRACVSAGTCAFPTSGTACNYPVTGRDDHPINCVNWNQAQTYCIWRGGSLPSEAQWEYVARGPSARLYPWGSEAPTSTLLCATPEGPPGTSTCPVATHRVGDSPFGAADMAGNVWEWVLEDYAAYTGSSTSFVTDPVGTMSSANRSIRGGAFNATGGDIFRGAYRSFTDVTNHRENMGFRCVHGPL